MKIIEIKPLENGGHRNQTYTGILGNVPKGWAVIPDSIAIPETFPFVNIELDGQTVIAMTAGTVPDPEPDPEPETTTEARVAALESENKTLKAQVSAQSEQMDFYEECIAEMASVVYA